MAVRLLLILALFPPSQGSRRKDTATFPPEPLVEEQTEDWGRRQAGKENQGQKKPQWESKFYDLNAEKVQQLWHHAMVKALLKAKARAAFASLPRVESVVYKQCELDAKSLAQLARCVVRLFDERDRAKERAEEESRKQSERMESLQRQPQPPIRLFSAKTHRKSEVTLVETPQTARLEAPNEALSVRRGVASESGSLYSTAQRFESHSVHHDYIPAQEFDEMLHYRDNIYRTSDFLIYGNPIRSQRKWKKRRRQKRSKVDQHRLQERDFSHEDRLQQLLIEFQAPLSLEKSSRIEGIIDEVTGVPDIIPIREQQMDGRNGPEISIKILSVTSHNNTTNKVLSIPSRNPFGLPRFLRFQKKRDEEQRSSVREKRVKREKIREREVGEIGGIRKKRENKEKSSKNAKREQKEKREKREAEDSFAPPPPTSPNLDISRLAANYFKKFLGSKTFLGGGGNSEQGAYDKLRLIKEHFERVERCNSYFKLMSEENKAFFKKLGLSFDVQDPKVDGTKDAEILEEILHMVGQFTPKGSQNQKTWSVLSPRFFSLFPQGNKNRPKELLSPTVLSFHRDGYISIPDILSMLTSSKSSQRMMIETALSLSGASEALDVALVRLKPEMKHTKEVQYPLVQMMSKLDHNWLRVKRSFSFKQEKAVEQKGYAFLEPHQLEIVYGRNNTKLRVDLNEYGAMSEEEREVRIERDIRRLAHIGKERKVWPNFSDEVRQKRDVSSELESVRKKWYEKNNTVTEEQDKQSEVYVNDELRIIPESSFKTLNQSENALDPAVGSLEGSAALPSTGNASRPVAHAEPVPPASETVPPASELDLRASEAVPPGEEPAEASHGATDSHGDTDIGNGLGGEGAGEHGDQHERVNGILFETLEPFAFTNIINQGAALEVVTLSPHAFIGEILSPEALLISTLSPRAFIATVLSPAALTARVLSPTALRAEVLSPRALYAWILSPEALVAEVLTPRMLEARVLSPETLVIDVLSPGILSPHVLSSETLGLMILSPNILSPRIQSEEKYLVEVLSPHILGGPHTKEEEENDVVQVGGTKEHEGEEKGGPDHPAHGGDALSELLGGGHHHGHKADHEKNPLEKLLNLFVSKHHDPTNIIIGEHGNEHGGHM